MLLSEGNAVGGGAGDHVMLSFRWSQYSWPFSFFMRANIVTIPSLLRRLVDISLSADQCYTLYTI